MCGMTLMTGSIVYLPVAVSGGLLDIGEWANGSVSPSSSRRSNSGAEAVPARGHSQGGSVAARATDSITMAARAAP